MRDSGAVSQDSSLLPQSSSSAAGRARSRSGSLSTPSVSSQAPRERSATATGSPTLSKPARAASGSAASSSSTTPANRPPAVKRPSAKGKNLDIIDVDDDAPSATTSRPPPSLSPTLLSTAAFSTQGIISPNPSPSIATDSRHASGTTSYVTQDALGLATLDEQSTPTGGAPGGNASGSRGAFGKGIATAILPGSMRSDTTSPTSFDGDTTTADSSAISSIATASQGYSSRSGSVSGPSTAESQARGGPMTAAFPSYLKIPTLIPSKQQQPTLPPTSSSPSAPSSPTGSAPGSGHVTPNSSGWSAAAGTAKAPSAVLNTEEVVLAPGSASRVSSPMSEDVPLPEQPATPTAAPIAKDAADAADETNEAESQGRAEGGEDELVKGSASLSRTPTPTQKSHAAKALTPARAPSSGSDAPAWLPTTEDFAAAAQRQRVHIATGLASGATTPVMPIPPGLTSAPPSAGMPMVSSSAGGSSHGLQSMDDNSTAKRLADLSIDVPAATAAPSIPLSSGQKTPTGNTGSGGGMTASDSTSSNTTATGPTAAVAAPAGSATPKSRQQAQSQAQQAPPHLTPYYFRNARGPVSLMPIVLTWRGGGREVFVTGTFANEWRSKILLKKTAAGHGASSSTPGAHQPTRRSAGAHRSEEHSVVLHLPPGTHRMKFIVDDRWRVSRELPTATDGDGNLVNYLEIPNVGPAHSGPLSAPGEDLVDVEAARERERRRERDVERIREAQKRRPGSAGRGSSDGRDTAALTAASGPGGSSGGSGGSGTTLSSQQAQLSNKEASAASDSAAAQLHHESRRRAVLDLQEEARRAELVRNGNLEDVFGLDDEALRAAETWVQEVPEGVLRAQQAEEAYRDAIEANEGGGADQPDSSNLPLPPSLPRQLEKVILNSSPANPALAPPGGLVDDNSILPAPNHVVLNHLTASAIKGGVLAVGTTTRYKRKYVTTVFYRPVQA